MSLSLISKLKTLVEEGGSKKKIEAYEDVVVEEIEKYVKEESFYELPTNEILKIVVKSEIGDIDVLCELVSRTRSKKRGESTLLLNVIKREEATLEECIKILSTFKQCPICQLTSELFNGDKKMPERDYEHEIEILKKEIEKLQNKTKETEEKKTCFPPVTEKPSDFESDILKAAEKGKLTSVQYLVEECHADVETKDNYGRTPIMRASCYGKLEVVKYLYETCHANITTETILKTYNKEIKEYLLSKM